MTHLNTTATPTLSHMEKLDQLIKLFNITAHPTEDGTVLLNFTEDKKSEALCVMCLCVQQQIDFDFENVDDDCCVEVYDYDAQ